MAAAAVQRAIAGFDEAVVSECVRRMWVRGTSSCSSSYTITITCLARGGGVVCRTAALCASFLLMCILTEHFVFRRQVLVKHTRSHHLDEASTTCDVWRVLACTRAARRRMVAARKYLGGEPHAPAAAGVTAGRGHVIQPPAHTRQAEAMLLGGGASGLARPKPAAVDAAAMRTEAQVRRLPPPAQNSRLAPIGPASHSCGDAGRSVGRVQHAFLRASCR